MVAMGIRRMVAMVGVLVALAMPVSADMTFSGFDLGGREGKVTFYDVTGGLFKMRLYNSSLMDVTAPDQLLTAMFFDIAGAPALTPVSAVLAPGSAVFYGGTDPGNVIGGEWAVVSNPVPGFNYGISSAGFGIFGGASFPGSNLQGPAAVNGMQYGITSAGDDVSTGNAAVTGGFALVKHAVDFTFTGLPDGFDLGKITDVYFQYGTSLTEPGVRAYCEPEEIPSTPEPASLGLLGAGVVALWRRRRARA